MSDDIPQDQVEAVARALAAHDSHGSGKFPADHFWAWQKDRAIAAIRAATPMIIAVERERCAEIADAYATAALAYAPEDAEETHVIAARSIAFEIRSVKGAVT